MSDSQTSHPISGKYRPLASQTSTETTQRSVTCSDPINTSCSSITRYPTLSLHHESSSKSTAGMLMQLPILWLSRLATATSKSASEESSQAEKAISTHCEIEGLPSEDIANSPSKKSSAQGYLEVVKLSSAGREQGRDWDRDGDGGAVVDGEMLCMRALVDGVHIIYF